MGIDSANVERKLISRNKRKTLTIEPEEMNNVETLKSHVHQPFILDANSQNNLLKKYKQNGNKTMESDNQMKTTLFSKENLETQFIKNQTLARNPELYCAETLGFHYKKGENQTSNVVANSCKGKGFSVPSFLREVFNKELGDRSCCNIDHKLVVIAIQAVLKHSRFIVFDNVNLQDVWSFSFIAFTFFLTYHPPEMVQTPGVVETIKLKVKPSGGKELILYGSLARQGSVTYEVCLDEERLAIALNLIWSNSDTSVEKKGYTIHPEKEVTKFWNTMKDELVLPLLIDLCDMANLPSPSCFASLPKDLKLEILELLPGVDVAKAACVSKELRLLSSSDDFWKTKIYKEFGITNVAIVVAEELGFYYHWKKRFAKAWDTKKRNIIRTTVLLNELEAMLRQKSINGGAELALKPK